MKNLKLTAILLATFICLVISPPLTRAQTVTSTETNQVVADAPRATDSVTLEMDDSTKQVTIPADEIGAPSQITFLGIKIPTWVNTLFTILLAALPTIQIILKKIPTDTSIKIGGILGKILDVITFFQRDVGPDGKTLKKTAIK